MIKSKGRLFEVECDDCGDKLMVDEPNWKDMIESIKEEGWRIKKGDDDDVEWLHYCPDCVQSKAKEYNRRR